MDPGSDSARFGNGKERPRTFALCVAGDPNRHTRQLDGCVVGARTLVGAVGHQPFCPAGRVAGWRGERAAGRAEPARTGSHDDGRVKIRKVGAVGTDVRCRWW